MGAIRRPIMYSWLRRAHKLIHNALREQYKMLKLIMHSSVAEDGAHVLFIMHYEINMLRLITHSWLRMLL